MNRTEKVAYALAAALLIDNGEIALSDIAALPLVENDDVVTAITARLRTNFDTYEAQKRIDGDANSPLEDVIVLRTPLRLRSFGRNKAQPAPSARIADADASSYSRADFKTCSGSYSLPTNLPKHGCEPRRFFGASAEGVFIHVGLRVLRSDHVEHDIGPTFEGKQLPEGSRGCCPWSFCVSSTPSPAFLPMS
jgi:hypothetical protein